MVALFLALVLFLFPPLPPHVRAEGLARELAADLRGQGVGCLRRADLPPGTSLALDLPRGRVLEAPGVPPPPPDAWQGRRCTLLVHGVGLVVYEPVGDAVLSVRQAGGPPPGSMEALLRTMLAASLVCALAGLALSTWLTRPLRRLVRTVRAFGPGRMDLRAPEGGPGELAELASAFNEMAGRLEEAEASRREFLAGVSHSLGTPLAAVQGWMELLLDGLVEPAERTELLRRARREVLHVSRTVGQLLDLSRWERSAPELLLEPLPMAELLMEVVDLLDGPAEAQLRFEGLDPGLRVLGDRARVRQLLGLLLEDAVEQGGPVTVRFRRTGASLEVEIGAERAPRRHASGSRGEGLGLAVAQRLVESHGGRLQVAPAAVRFSLPLAPA